MTTTAEWQGNIRYHEGDTSPAIQLIAKRDGSPIDLSTVNTVTLKLYPRGYEEQAPKESIVGTLPDAVNGLTQFVPTATFFDTAGDFSAVLELDWGGGNIETLPDPGYIGVTVHRKG